MSRDQGAYLADTENLPGMVFKKDTERIRADQDIDRFFQRLKGIALIKMIQQAGRHFRVCLGTKAAAKAKSGRNLMIVFNDAVVDQRNLPAGVRMGVHIGHAAMGRPTGMPDPAASLDGRSFTGFAQNGNPAGLLLQE